MDTSKMTNEQIRDELERIKGTPPKQETDPLKILADTVGNMQEAQAKSTCLLYTSPSPRDATLSRMPSSA